MKILGLLDTLESMILDGFKIPMSKRTLINEEQLLSVVDKIRLVIQEGGDFNKRASEKPRAEIEKTELVRSEEPQILARDDKAKATEIIEQSYKIAKEVREGADRYADEVLANLELTSSRVLRTIKAGRDRLKTTVQGEKEIANVQM